MAKHYENLTKTVLSDYITPDKFRTVMPPQWEFNAGYSEIPVAITLKKETADKLSFNVPWDGMIYGFIRGKFQLQEKLEMKNVPTMVSISDWETKFVLVFEEKDPKETKAFEIESSEVIYLLENCTRVPEQKVRTDKK